MTIKELKNLEKFILEKLRNELNEHYYYHSPEHTKRVLEKSKIIAKYEKVNKNDLKLITIAALFHDIGFIKSRENHEEIGCVVARNLLNKHNLKQEEIDKICGMIMATKIPQTPLNQLEEILADADLEYLGTEDFKIISDYLFKELKFFSPELTEETWNKIQVNFLESHTYFTSYGKKFLSDVKKRNFNDLLKKINIQKKKT